jgi:hypothetical protein
MINAKLFVSSHKKYALENFNMFEGEEGGPEDRPLIVQVITLWLILTSVVPMVYMSTCVD